jgi:hypothetical protein
MCRIVFAASVLSFRGPSWGGSAASSMTMLMFGEAAIFDVVTDPLETADITDSVDATIKAELEARLSFWGAMAAANPPLLETSISDSVAGIWDDAGGVVPFTDSYGDEPDPPVIPSVQAAAGAPNIVFVLLDDVGYSDLSYHSTSWMPDASPNLKKLAAESVELTQYYTAHVRSIFLFMMLSLL